MKVDPNKNNNKKQHKDDAVNKRLKEIAKKLDLKDKQKNHRFKIPLPPTLKKND